MGESVVLVHLHGEHFRKTRSPGWSRSKKGATQNSYKLSSFANDEFSIKVELFRDSITYKLD